MGYAPMRALPSTSRLVLTMILLWLLIWYVAGHDPLLLDPVNAWAATLILALGLDLARAGGVPQRGS